MTKDPLFDAMTTPEPNTGCLLWAGCVRPVGKSIRGMIKRGKTVLPAHRYAWILANGPVPSDMFVMHRCGNPLCVAIAHLELVPRRDDSHEAKEASREKKKRTGRAWRERNWEFFLTINRESKRRNRSREYNAAYRREQLAAQGGRCDICGTSEPKGKGWTVDHCHSFGRNVQLATARAGFRGVLCMNCNTHLLAAVEKNPSLRAKVPVVDAYLTKWEAVIASRRGLLDAA